MIKLNDYQKTKEIPKAIQQYLEDKGISQAQLCKSSSVGETYVSHIIQGKTHIGKTEIKDKYYTQICEFINYKIEFKIWRHFNTANFKLLIEELKYVRSKKGRIALDGDTGAGKTYACSKYKQNYPNNTFVVKCSAVENSKEFAINIAEVVGVKTHGTSGTIIKRVVKKLLEKDDAILIIDESEHIKNKSGYIHIIKSLTDMLENKVAMVLVGMDIGKILKEGYDKKKQVFRQTARRFSKRSACNDDIREDIIKICQTLGIKSHSVQNWLANRIENFDELKELLVSAIEVANKTNTTVTIKLLQTFYDG